MDANCHVLVWLDLQRRLGPSLLPVPVKDAVGSIEGYHISWPNCQG